MKKIAILGSTGSIGTQTLEIVRTNKDIEVTALAAGRNIDLLEQQIREFTRSLQRCGAKSLQRNLKPVCGICRWKSFPGWTDFWRLRRKKIRDPGDGHCGDDRDPADHRGNPAGKDIALANKETLVTAGHIIMPLAEQYHVSILPVDSEHSAIFQSLQGGQEKALHKILLTASGGPFRGKKREELENIRVEDALKHPNWAMGRKITIDSSTMVNKGLEVIEAKWLFGVTVDQIQVVVQPQSIIHSMVVYEDGAVIAQLGTPDMKLPIQYALYYPERRYLPGDRLDFGNALHRSHSRSRIWRRSTAEAGNRGGAPPAALCRRCLMRPMRKRLRSSWTGRSVISDPGDHSGVYGESPEYRGSGRGRDTKDRAGDI